MIVTFAVAPVPDDDMQSLDANDSELAAMLEAMGYTFAPEEDDP